MPEYPLRVFTAREALLEIRRRILLVQKRVSCEDLEDVAKEGLDCSAPENYETIDRLADRLAEAHEVLRKFHNFEAEVDGLQEALALPPDLEAMIERRLGAPREPIETAEQVRLKLADILIEGRAQVLRKMGVEEKPRVRAVLGEVDELIQAMFEQFAPERWAEELAKFEAAEAEAEVEVEVEVEDKDAIEVMAKALAKTRAREWENAPELIKEGYRDQARAALEAYGELGRERADADEEVGGS